MYTTDFAQVGRNIQNELILKRMTQQSLADALGISKQVMSKIVKGNKAINVGELGRIANLLGTTTDKLLMDGGMAVREVGLSYMGRIHDEKTREKVEFLKTVMDEIQLLEDLNDE